MSKPRAASALAAVAVAVVLLVSCGAGDTGAADQVTDYGARLNGKAANTLVGATTYHFEHGPTDSYGSTTPTRSAYVLDPSVAVPVSASVKGLAEGTEYHYRLCAYDVDGHGACGLDQSFTTSSGHDYVFGEGVTLDLGFGVIGGRADAQSGPDGSDPTGRAGGVPGARSVRWFDEGPVTCLHVEGNRAPIGYLADPIGVGPPDEDLPVPEMVFVEDNGPTGDRWSGVQVLSAPATTCPTPTAADFPTDPAYSVLTSGDFTVRDVADDP
jgi:hypothetical protein